MRCLGETALSFSPSAAVFSKCRHSNAVINWHNTRPWWIFLLVRLCCAHPKKTVAITLPADGTAFAFFWAGSPFRVHSFDCYLDSRVWWWAQVSSSVMNRHKNLNGSHLYSNKHSVGTSSRRYLSIQCLSQPNFRVRCCEHFQMRCLRSLLRRAPLLYCLP